MPSESYFNSIFASGLNSRIALLLVVFYLLRVGFELVRSVFASKTSITSLSFLCFFVVSIISIGTYNDFDVFDTFVIFSGTFLDLFPIDS